MKSVLLTLSNVKGVLATFAIMALGMFANLMAVDPTIPDIGIDPSTYISGAVAKVAIGAGIAISFIFAWIVMRKLFTWGKKALG